MLLKRNRMFRTLAIFTLILSLGLAACAPASEPAAEVDEQPAGEEASSEEVAEEPASESGEELYTVKFVVWPGPESDAAQVMVDYFNANHAAEAGFNVELLLFGRDQLFAKQDAIMAAQSSEVDTFFVTSPTLLKYQQFLEPLDSYLEDPEVNLWGATPDDLMSGVIGAYYLDGALYGLPSDVSTHFLYYRTDYIGELLTNADWQATYTDICEAETGQALEPKEPAEWTWDDYVCASYFFTQQYNPDSPTVYGNYTQGKAIFPTSFQWSNTLWSYGGEWFTEAGDPDFLSDAAMEAAQIWALNWEAELTPAGSITGEYPEANEAFKTGNVAFGLQWNAAFNELNAEDSPVHGLLNIVATPAGPAGRYTYTQSIGYGLSAFSEHKEEAASWLLWTMTEEANQVYAEAGGVPAHAAVLSGMAGENLMFGALSEVVGNYGRPVLPQAGYFQDMVIENLANGWSGSVSLEEALQQLQDDATIEKESRGL
ncbi:MAG: extracellular solute-binding protein [Anaerolineales bacterium]|nr:extracellular solute-binding protein [Anaerolineales bacterium]